MNLSFLHAGDAGDIIYSLPVMRYMGGGDLFLESTDFTRLEMTPERVASMRPLLESQPYIKSVQFHNGRECAVDLNAFRLRFLHNHRTETLAQMQCRSHGVPETELDKPWIDVPPKAEKPVIINLTERYRNREFPWGLVMGKYGKHAGFVGSEKEHRLFVKEYGEIPHVPTPTLLDLAMVIKGSKLFVGNQSLPLALAHAMHHPTVCEMSRTGIDGWHRKINCVGTAGSTITLPELSWETAKHHSAVTLRLRSALETVLTWARAATQ